MVRNYKRKTEEVDRECLLEAIAAVKEGRLTQREAARNYVLCRATLQKYLKKPPIEVPDRIRQGRYRPVFTPAQEEELVEYLIDLSFRFYGMTRKALVEKAFLLAEANRIPHPFKNGAAGYEWSCGFLKRHKDRLSMRTAQPLCISRIVGFRKSSVYHFFDNLEKVIRENGFGARQIFNADETGISIVSSRALRVVAPRGVRGVSIIKPAERGRLVTVIACCSAAGQFLPPFFIFPGNPAACQDSRVAMGPAGTSATNTKKGWVTGDAFLEWMHHFAIQIKPGPQNKVLLLLDNHVTHISLQVIEFAVKNCIDIVTLPPHTSHRLQPLDVAFFSPLKQRYAEAMLSWQREHPFQKPSELDLPQILKKPFEESCKIQTAINGFSKTGIWDPVRNQPNRHIFCDSDFSNEIDQISSRSKPRRQVEKSLTSFASFGNIARTEDRPEYPRDDLLLHHQMPEDERVNLDVQSPSGTDEEDRVYDDSPNIIMPNGTESNNLAIIFSSDEVRDAIGDQNLRFSSSDNSENPSPQATSYEGFRVSPYELGPLIPHASGSKSKRSMESAHITTDDFIKTKRVMVNDNQARTLQQEKKKLDKEREKLEKEKEMLELEKRRLQLQRDMLALVDNTGDNNAN